MILPVGYRLQKGERTVCLKSPVRPQTAGRLRPLTDPFSLRSDNKAAMRGARQWLCSVSNANIGCAAER